MAYDIRRAAGVTQDLDLIFDHLLQSYIALGEPAAVAFERAAQRLNLIRSDMDALARMPHKGNLDPEILPGLRHVTKNRAIFYFHVNDAESVVHVLAVFFGGQDHHRHMLARLAPGKRQR